MNSPVERIEVLRSEDGAVITNHQRLDAGSGDWMPATRAVAAASGWLWDPEKGVWYSGGRVKWLADQERSRRESEWSYADGGGRTHRALAAASHGTPSDDRFDLSGRESVTWHCESARLGCGSTLSIPPGCTPERRAEIVRVHGWVHLGGNRYRLCANWVGGCIQAGSLGR